MSAYYRSQFLNTVLPGGVIGDIHRAVAHGRSVSRVPQASRAVVAERAAGQAVQLVLAAVVLVSVGMSGYAPAVSTVLLAVAVACVGARRRSGSQRACPPAITRELTTLRSAFGTVGTVVEVSAASSIVILGHVATFVVACLAVGVEASPERLAAVALIVMLAGSIPLNIGGWGPREGAAAWAFAAAGLGAAAGIAASTAFGVLAMIAVAPGAAVVAASALRRRHECTQARQAVSVMNRPYVTLSCAMSLDGYLDSATPRKLAMSNAADFDRVDQLRAESDAIMVGASTVRRDCPRLMVRSGRAAAAPRSPRASRARRSR